MFRSRRAGPARAAAVETLEAAATDALVEKSVNTIRFLAIDAVEKANSGHPGLPMGCAPMGHILYDEVMKYNPKNPYWFNRDRFVLSAGHGCMLHYALLHLAGYDSVKVRPLTSLGLLISLRERWQLDDRLNLMLLSVTFDLMWDERLEFDFSSSPVFFLHLFNCLISLSSQISTGFDGRSDFDQLLFHRLLYFYQNVFLSSYLFFLLAYVTGKLIVYCSIIMQLILFLGVEFKFSA